VKIYCNISIFYFDFGILIDRNIFYRDDVNGVCFVPNCKTPKGLPLYNFPFGDKRLLDLWAERTGLSTMYDTELYLNITICKSHFHENCFHENTIQLKPYAIPSINLIGKYILLNTHYQILFKT